MKQGKNPTLKQKIALTEAGLNHDDWLVTKNLVNVLEIVHRSTGTKNWIVLNKEKRRRRL